MAADALARGAPAAAVAWLGERWPSRRRLRPGGGALELGSAEFRVAGARGRAPSAAVELIREPEQLATSVRLLANALTMTGQRRSGRRSDRVRERVVEPTTASCPCVSRLSSQLTRSKPAARRARQRRRLERHRELSGATAGERFVLAYLAYQRARASESALEAVVHVERALADGWPPREEELDLTGAFYLLMVGLRDTDSLDLAVTWRCWDGGRTCPWPICWRRPSSSSRT